MAREPEIRATRRVRRVLLVLLTGAGNLGSRTIGHLAGDTAASAYVTLHQLMNAGWVEREWAQIPPAGQPGRRRLYHLTPQGRAKAIGLLKLEMPDD